jgi:uncharacterized Zn-binding protein involved in type VI secretion
MKHVIRVDDPTDHGGQVLTGCAPYLPCGRPVARIGDKCSCPMEGHDDCTIIEGDPNHLVSGIPVAFEGCHTDCGAVQEATLETDGVE